MSDDDRADERADDPVGDPAAAGQLGLSFGAEYDAVLTAGSDVTEWPGYVSVSTGSHLARIPRILVSRLLRELGSGLLRLGLCIAAIASVVHTFPYQAKVQGVRFSVQASVITRPGLSADTTLGNWEFPRFTGLPVGVHVTPQNVDLIALADRAGPNTDNFVTQLRDGVSGEIPRIALWLAGEVILGGLIGLLLAAAFSLALRYMAHRPWRVDEAMHQLRHAGAAALVLLLVTGYGALTYDPNWLNRSRLTGTLAAAQLFPSQLAQYYNNGSKAVDAIGAVIGIQAALQSQIDSRSAPATAYRIMYISDVHLAAVYPLVARYAEEWDVGLIVNTGDETEFGQRAELTPTYLAGIKAITATTPMLWLAGNHDSPEVVSVMRSIKGVTVLGTKSRTSDGGYSVTASSVDAYGLTIAGLPDPRVYGGGGAYGSDDTATTDPLERQAVDDAVSKTDTNAYDIFATHEPVQAKELRTVLGDRLRQTVSGHVHKQNGADELQHGSQIDLVEGSTGAGGLDNLARATPPPVEFSIESVGADCQFTRVVRFQITSATAATDTEPQAYGDDVSVSTIYFSPQKIAADRACAVSKGINAR